MNALDTLLHRCGVKAKSNGTGQWSCKCPAHPDRSPSLTIKQTSDGTILIHCFAGCEPNDILAAVGLNIRDLFPKALADRYEPKPRHGVSAFDALRAVRHELIVIELLAEDLARGTCDPTFRQRAQLAADRIHTALSICDG